MYITYTGFPLEFRSKGHPLFIERQVGKNRKFGGKMHNLARQGKPLCIYYCDVIFVSCNFCKILTGSLGHDRLVVLPIYSCICDALKSLW